MLDDLTTPLGLSKNSDEAKRKRAAGLMAALPKIVAGVLGAFILVFVGWALFASSPYGGEPMAVVPANTQAADAAPPASGSDAAAADKPRATADTSASRPNRYDGPAQQAPAPASVPAGTPSTVTIIDGTSGKRQQVEIPSEPADNGSAPPVAQHADPRLTEPSRFGPLPRIAPDGERPAQAFAQPVKPSANNPNVAKVALIVTGLGISASGTSAALARLPGAVSFAFAPYGADLDRLAERAREADHELLLQIPMEPIDYPDNDPGPQTLLTTLDTEQNLQRLYSLMGRMQGYVGIANYMGTRFTASEPALTPVLRETARRGLIYVEDGSSARSIAGQIAGANNLPYAKADLAIDAVPTGVEIDRALGRLEMIARERGIAVGVAKALPVSIDRIANWAKSAERRGIVLVPITAVAVRAKSS